MWACVVVLEEQYLSEPVKQTVLALALIVGVHWLSEYVEWKVWEWFGLRWYSCGLYMYNGVFGFDC